MARSSFCLRLPTRAFREASSPPLANFTFIGVTTGQSAAIRLFPRWAAELGITHVRLVGCDLPIHAEPERYREVVRRIKSGERELGALVTTHKIDLFRAARDLFDRVDEWALLCEETSCLSKSSGQLWARATDPVAAARALSEFWSAGREEVLCLGAGGSAVAITCYLLRMTCPPRQIIVVDRSSARLVSMRKIHSRLQTSAKVEYVENADPRVNDQLIKGLPSGSLVINATGLGKDSPGSPITSAAQFPEGGLVWELNYRGELEFLHQALDQKASRGLQVHDGWRYFLHGWALTMEHVFHIRIDDHKFCRLAALSEPERPLRD